MTVAGCESTAARPTRGVLGTSLLHHGVRAAGTFLGGHAERLPAWLVAHLSLERRV